MIHPKRGNAHNDDKAQCNSLPGRLKVEASDALITSTIVIYDRISTVLFDPRFTYSYVSTNFALAVDLICDTILCPYLCYYPS